MIGPSFLSLWTYLNSTMVVKMQILASDRGKIVESHRKPRDNALSHTSKSVVGPRIWEARRGSILTGTQFSMDPPLGLSWKGGFSELRNFPRFFHDFSTIFQRFVSRNTKNHHVSLCAKNGNLSSKMAVAAGIEPTTCSLGESRSIQLSYATARVFSSPAG